MKESIRIYNELRDKALPFIKSYKKDLLCWDFTCLLRNPGKPFLHFTGDTGTHIEVLIPAHQYPAKGKMVQHIFGMADRDHLLNEINTCVKQMRRLNRQDLIMYYDGQKLKEITQDKAEEIVFSYVNKTKHDFN